MLAKFITELSLTSNSNLTEVLFEGKQETNLVLLNTYSVDRRAEKFITALNEKMHDYQIIPLCKVLWTLIHEQQDDLKHLLRKKNGYFSRIFSNETWSEWFEDRTALGRVVNLFIDYLEGQISSVSKVNQLDSEIILNANKEANQFLAGDREKHSTEMFWPRIMQILNAIEQSFSLIPGASATSQVDCSTDDNVETECDDYRKTLKHKMTLNEAQNVLAEYRVYPTSWDHCRASQSIQKITTSFFCKYDSLSTHKQLFNKAEIDSALEEIQQLADASGLQQCYTNLIKLIEKFQGEAQYCTPMEISKLPSFLSSIVKATNYNIDERIIFSKINEFAIKMIPKLEGSDKKLYSQFIDLLYLTVKRLPNDDGIGIQTIKVLHELKKKNAFVNKEQKKFARSLAKRYSRGYTGTELQKLASLLLAELRPSFPMCLLFDLVETLSSDYDAFSEFSFGQLAITGVLCCSMLYTLVSVTRALNPANVANPIRDLGNH